MKTYTSYMNEVGYSGRSIRNVDPIQYMIRSILSGEMNLDIVKNQPDIIKARIIRDVTDITQGQLPMWMPQKFKLPANKKRDLIKQLSKVDSR
jgi:phenylpyruvate tautomerase PptA (4-oxalocrotonate tautomerase family)